MATMSRTHRNRLPPPPPPVIPPPIVPPPVVAPPVVSPPAVYDPEPPVPVVKIRAVEPRPGRSRRARRPWAATVFCLVRDISLLAVSVGFLYLTYRAIERQSAAPTPAVTHGAAYATNVEPATPRATRSVPRRSEPQPNRQDRPRLRQLPPPTVEQDPLADENPSPLGSAGATDVIEEPQPAESPAEPAPPPILPDGVPQWANDSVFDVLDGTTAIAKTVEEHATNGVTTAGLRLTLASEIEQLRKSLTGQRMRIYCQVEDVTLSKPGQPAFARLSRVEQLGSVCLKSIYVNPLEVDLTTVRKGDYLQVDGVLEKPSRRAQQRADLQFAVRTKNEQLTADYQLMLYVTAIESVTAERWKEIQQRRLE